MIMKKVCLILLIILLSGFTPFFSKPVAASWTTLAGNEVYVREGEVTEGDLWVMARSVEIKGRIKGDLLVFAEDLKISGQVDGALLGLAGRTELSGEILGNLRMASMFTKIDGLVAGNFSAVGTELLFGPKATASSLLAWFTLTNIAGEIKEAAVVKGNIFNLTGKIGEDLKIGATKVNISENARIGGDFLYPVGVEPVLEPGFRVGGKINKFQTAPAPGATAFKGLWFLGGLLLGVVWLLIFPRRWAEIISASSLPWRRIIVLGIGGLFLLPLLSLLFSVMLIGLPLGICLLVIFLILLFFGELPSYLLVGRLLFGSLQRKRKAHPVFLFVAGGFILAFLKFLPYIGFIFMFVSKILGNGLLLSYLFFSRNPSKTIEVG
jgi:cytoskeletal protein CcmA (bactofilin family)